MNASNQSIKYLYFKNVRGKKDGQMRGNGIVAKPLLLMYV